MRNDGRTAIRALALAGALFAAACASDENSRFTTPLCSADQIACGLQCDAVASDANNCGACGFPCASGQTCTAGVCQCPAGMVDCNGTCTAPGAGECGTAGAPGSPPLLVTSAPDDYWKTDGSITEVTGHSADVTVDAKATAQLWEGFGGAFNEMGWNFLSMLTDAERDAAIRLLFGADGARFAFGRIPIGASDYAMDRYTLDETAGDTSLASFSIDRDMQKLIPYVKAAQAVKGNIRF